MKIYYLMAFMTASLMLLINLPQTNAIPNYQQCLDCFYANRTNFYYCKSTRQCLPVKSTSCPAKEMVKNNYQCVEGYQLCSNVTFNQNSVGSSNTYGYGLPAGQGCYIQIDRDRNGSYGTVAINFDDPSIIVFDSKVKNYQAGQVLGLPITDYGWGPRKVFVVNKGDQPAGF